MTVIRIKILKQDALVIKYSIFFDSNIVIESVPVSETFWVNTQYFVQALSPEESPHGGIREEETHLLLPHRVQRYLETDGAGRVGDLLPGPLHPDPVPEAPGPLLATRHPHPEVEEPPLTGRFRPARDQQEEQLALVGNTLGTPPPALLLLIRIERYLAQKSSWFYLTSIVCGYVVLKIDDFGIEIDEEKSEESSSLWWMKSWNVWY